VNSYLVPQTVYVGDRATLVVLLENPPESGAALTGKPPAVPDMVIHRVELERRGENGRLLIDFTAYAPGMRELPPFEIGGILFSGLRFEIASILGTDETARVLSRPALSLAVPGTGILVYGAVSGIILAVLVFLWALVFGPRRFESWRRRRKRKRLIASLAGMERRMRKKVIRENRAAKNFGDLLNVLAAEFRIFLALFTGENCKAMTAGELSRLAVPEPAEGDDFSRTGAFLGGFFRRCDDLRFSGAETPKNEFLAILGELKNFIDALNRAERTRPAGTDDLPRPAKGGKS
jgi:hypothetical protein